MSTVLVSGLAVGRRLQRLGPAIDPPARYRARQAFQGWLVNPNTGFPVLFKLEERSAAPE